MTTTIERVAVDDLSFGCLSTIPTSIEDWSSILSPEDGQERGSYWEAFDYSFDAEDGTTHELVLVTTNGSSVDTVFLADGTRIDIGDTSGYLSDNEDENGDPEAGSLSTADLSDLEDVEPVMHGADGPMMNYWYSLQVEDGGRYGDDRIGGYNHKQDAVGCAFALQHTNLCLVQVDGTYGLALTGGGMDFTWEIVEAFTRLGYLPPVHFTDLPGMAGSGTSERDRYIIAAVERTLRESADIAQRNLDRHRDRYAAKTS